MDHLAYYNEGCEPDAGQSGLMVWTRRQFRRILLPASNRLVQILGSLCHRLDTSESQVRQLHIQLVQLQCQVGDLRSQLGTLRLQLDDHHGQLDNHRHQLRAIPDRFDIVQAQIDDHAIQLGALPDRCDELAGKLNDHCGRLDDHCGRLDDHCGRLDDHRGQLAALPPQFDDLRRRHEEQVGRYPATVAFGWDYIALTRRLGILEEHVDALLAPPTGGDPEPDPAPAATDPVEAALV